MAESVKAVAGLIAVLGIMSLAMFLLELALGPSEQNYPVYCDRADSWNC